MWIYMYIYVHAHTYIHTYMHTYVYDYFKYVFLFTMDKLCVNWVTGNSFCVLVLKPTKWKC